MINNQLDTSEPLAPRRSKSFPAPLVGRVPQASVMLGISQRSVWDRLKDGTLPRVKVGGATVIPVAAIEALVRTTRTPGQSPEGDPGS